MRFKLGRFRTESQYSGKPEPVYIDGSFEPRDVESNWALYIDMPTLFVAYGPAVQSGNWRWCTSIANGYGPIQWQVESKPREWTAPEWWEFWGLVSGIRALNEAYEFARFGNNGIGDDKALLKCKDISLAQTLATKLDNIIPRANELLHKLQEV